MRRIGVLVAVIVLLFALGRITSAVVDWAWFSSIGYVGVFWTIFATKAFLFIAVFAVSTLLLWVNGTLAVRFASRRRLRLPAVRAPDFATVRALPATKDLLALVSPLLQRHLIILAVALVIGLLIAMLINAFVGSDTFEYVISAVGVVIFTGLTASDTQKIVRLAADPRLAGDGGALLARLSIIGALMLYLDFLNLFLFLLRIMGRRD